MTPIVLPPPVVSYGSGAPDRYIEGSRRSIPTTILDTVYEYNGLVVNDRYNLEHYWIKKFAGISDAEVRATSEDNPDRDGAMFFGGLYSSRPMSLEGYVKANSLDKLEDMWFALRDAFDDIDHELPLNGRTGDLQRDWFIRCAKSGQLAWDDEQTSYDFRRDFMIPLKATDPFIYGVNRRSAGANLNTSTNISCVNLGNRKVIKWQSVLYGRQDNIQILNNKTQQTFKFKTGTGIPASRIFTIDWGEGTIFDDLGVNQFDKYDNTSDWLILDKASENILTVTSTNKDANAALNSYWNDTYK